MIETTSLRVLFCLGVNQNFMSATQSEMGDVWQAFSAMINGVDTLPDVNILGIMDDDRIQVGPSASAPWTAYIMADVPNFDSAVSACDLVRSTPVGDGTYKLWKYIKIEARIGRGLPIPG